MSTVYNFIPISILKLLTPFGDKMSWRKLETAIYLILGVNLINHSFFVYIVAKILMIRLN